MPVPLMCSTRGTIIVGQKDPIPGLYNAKDNSVDMVGKNHNGYVDLCYLLILVTLEALGHVSVVLLSPSLIFVCLGS